MMREIDEPPAGDYVSVSVSDTGTGMSEHVLGKAFEPFFTTKEIGKGSGLGLGQVLGFAKQSGGGVRIDSSVGEGTSVQIFLPRSQVEHVERRLSPASGQPARKLTGATILLVDDDNQVRQIVCAKLHELGYRVLEAGSGGAVLDMLERDQSVELLVVAFAMPGMNGAELARHVRSRRPALPIIFATGFVDRVALAGIDESRIIGKPFSDGELAEKIATALAGDGKARNVIRFPH